MNVKIYTPSNSENPLQMLWSVAKGLAEGHSLGYRLFRRDMKASVEGSLLGFVWLFLPALAAAGIWILLNQQRVINVSSGQMAYPAYVLIGTTLWTIFTESINKPIQRYKAAMSMMTKLNFPREALLLAAIYDMLFSVFIKMIVLLPLLVFLGMSPSFSWSMSLLIALGVVFTGIAIGIFIAPFGILFNDLSRAINLILPFIMYLTPVVYALPKDSFLARAQIYNPVTPWIEYCRSFIGNYAFDMQTPLLLWLLVSLFMLCAGLIMMRIALPIIVERSGS